MTSFPPCPLPVDVETVTRAPAPCLPALEDVEPEPPRTLGRYAILDELGVGGMGLVLRAYDPKLDREVAIKLLREVTPDARARLRREAQAMAQLAHPHVLPVYDVADDGVHVFIAMELVRGRSVRDWLKEGPRPWSEALAVVVAAGRGLAAAHEAGLVHRDFKPGNVLIGEDGRVRVMDFGLARVARGSEDGSRGSRSSGPRSSDSWSRRSDEGASDETPLRPATRSLPVALPRSRVTDGHDVLASPAGVLTQTGTVLGTPAYMAPEQHVGQAVDHRCDQYAFCVTLWEAVYGRRPFQAKTLAGWHQAKLTATPKANPERGVPRWLHAVMLRGLSPFPPGRFPSMAALLHALAQGTRSRRQHRVLGLGLAGMLLVGGTGAALHGSPSLCTGAEDELAGIWDGTAASEVKAAMLASEVGYAADTWTRVAPELDGYAARWQAAHQDACEATHVRHEQPEALMDARMRCLDDRRRDLRALVRTLQTADAEIVERAVSAVGALPAIEPCTDPDYVRAQALPPTDPQQAAEAEAIDEELARIGALVEAGRGKAVEDDARAALERAVALGHAPLEARARFRIGLLEHHLGRYEASVEQLEQAYFVAQREHLDRLQADAAIRLVGVLGGQLELPEQAEQWARHAEAALERAPDPVVEAAHLGSVGVLAMKRGDNPEAMSRLERARALYEQQLGPDHPQVATVLNNLALVHDRMNRFDEAEALLERALAIRERALGPMHPDVALALANLAGVELVQADLERALERILRSLAIYEGAYGREHAMVGSALINLGNVYQERGEQRRALASYEEALPILEATRGSHHVSVIGTLVNMGAAYRSLGEPARAQERYERALGLLEKAPGHDFVHAAVLSNMAALSVEAGDTSRAEAQCLRGLELLAASAGVRHPMGALLQASLGLVRMEQGQPEEALRLHREALAVRRELLGPRHPETATSLSQLGAALVKAGKPKEAIEPLEEAIAIHEEDGGAEARDDERRAELHQARFWLARARWDVGIEREQAVITAREARTELREGSGVARAAMEEMEEMEQMEQMDAWLAKRGASKRAPR